MFVVTRFHETDIAFREELEAALAALRARPGFDDGYAGRNLDDPRLWVLVTRWRDVGSYRRALSSYEVKVEVVPLLSRALDEPSAFEPLDGELNRFEARGSGSIG